VSADRLLNAAKDPANWLTYSGTCASQRYSALAQITPANVKSLDLKGCTRLLRRATGRQARWWSTASCTSPSGPNDVLALDAKTRAIGISRLKKPLGDALDVWQAASGLDRMDEAAVDLGHAGRAAGQHHAGELALILASTAWTPCDQPKARP
jgi:hypothetical protein